MEKLAILVASLTFFAGCASTSSTGTASASNMETGGTAVGAPATSVSGTSAMSSNGQTSGVYNSAANPGSSPTAGAANPAAVAPAAMGTSSIPNQNLNSSPSGQQGVISGENATPKFSDLNTSSGASIYNNRPGSTNSFGANTNLLNSGTYSQDSTNPGATPNTPADKAEGNSTGGTPQ